MSKNKPSAAVVATAKSQLIKAANAVSQVVEQSGSGVTFTQFIAVIDGKKSSMLMIIEAVQRRMGLLPDRTKLSIPEAATFLKKCVPSMVIETLESEDKKDTFFYLGALPLFELARRSSDAFAAGNETSFEIILPERGNRRASSNSSKPTPTPAVGASEI